MASKVSPLLYTGTVSVQLTKWRVTDDFMINQSPFILFLYRCVDSTGSPTGDELKYKVNQSGITVRRLYKRVGELIQPAEPLLDYEPCSHSTLMKDLCAICGVNINSLDSSESKKIAANTSVSMVHSIPELRVSKEVANDLGRADEDRLLKSRKLVLLVDLDQTIIHSTNQVVPNDIPEIHHYQLYGPTSPWYHTKCRPFMVQFLEEISKYYELHICTFGARRYAHQISNLIDPKCRFFPKDRILSRDEFFDPRSKTGNMKSLFPCGDSMVCIIDDRVDVWNYLPNVVHVKPYVCFKTDDINAPEKLDIGFKGSKGELTDKDEAPSSKDDPKEETENAKTETEEVEKVENGTNEEDEKGVSEETKEEPGEIKSQDSTENTEGSPKVDAESEKMETSETATTSTTTGDSPIVRKSAGYENLIEDKDDYLLYLKDILIGIHREYYKEYEEKVRYQSEGEEILIPDLKGIIPRVRKCVLRGVNIVFSGVIATNVPPPASRFYRLAQSLGANVTNDIIVNGSPKTTHMVGAKWGTIKVNKCLKWPAIKLVTPDWLIVCAERWERVDEALFELKKETVYNMNEREDCRKVFIPYYEHKPKAKGGSSGSQASSSTAQLDDEPSEDLPDAGTMLSYSPLSNFSISDLSEMGKEVEDACSDGDFESSDSSDDPEDDDDDEAGGDTGASSSVQRKTIPKKPIKKADDEEADCMNYDNEGEYPQGWNSLAGKRRGMKRSKDDSDDEENAQEDDEASDPASSTDDDDDELSDGSLDEEAAALERQFQSTD